MVERPCTPAAQRVAAIPAAASCCRTFIIPKYTAAAFHPSATLADVQPPTSQPALPPPPLSCRAARALDTLMKELCVPLGAYIKGFPAPSRLHPFERALLELTVGAGTYERVLARVEALRRSTVEVRGKGGRMHAAMLQACRYCSRRHSNIVQAGRSGLHGGLCACAKHCACPWLPLPPSAGGQGVCDARFSGGQQEGCPSAAGGGPGPPAGRVQPRQLCGCVARGEWRARLQVMFAGLMWFWCSC